MLMKNWSDYFSDKKFRSTYWPGYTEEKELIFKGFKGTGLTISYEEYGRVEDILDLYTKNVMDDYGKPLPSNIFRTSKESKSQ